MVKILLMSGKMFFVYKALQLMLEKAVFMSRCLYVFASLCKDVKLFQYSM